MQILLVKTNYLAQMAKIKREKLHFIYKKVGIEKGRF